MPNFTDIELTTVKNMMLTASIRDIAFILDRSEVEIRLVMKELKEEDTITRQDIIDENAVKRQKTAKPAKKVKVESQEQKLKRERLAERSAAHRQRMNMEEARRKEKLAARLPAFKTKVVDYSIMRSVKIDRKTTIILKPGEDKEKAIAKYLAIHKKKPVSDD